MSDVRWLIVLTAIAMIGCGDTWERRQHPCGYDDGQWVWHKRLKQNVIVDRVIGDRDQFWTVSGEHFPLRCEDLEDAQ